MYRCYKELQWGQHLDELLQCFSQILLLQDSSTGRPDPDFMQRTAKSTDATEMYKQLFMLNF